MQLKIDLEPGLTHQFSSLDECIATCVHSAQSGVKRAAAVCDVAPSEMSKRLSGAENRGIKVRDLEPILDELGDLRPVMYLVEKYLRRPDVSRDAVVAKLDQLQRDISIALADLKATGE